MAKNKFYAVVKGRIPGLYTSWNDCKAQVDKFPGAQYQGFPDEASARAYLGATEEKGKFYGVHVGRVPGVYTDWAECKEQVDKFPGAIYKSFSYRSEAEAFVATGKVAEAASKEAEDDASNPLLKEYSGNHVWIFTDGSYNSSTDEAGYGVYVADGKNPRIFTGKIKCQAGGNNIESEIKGATVALTYALEEYRKGHYDSVTIGYDLNHIGLLIDGGWTAGTDYNRDYQAFVAKVREQGLAVDFVHTKGHTGIEGNEYVDKLAKIACGVPLKKGERTFIEKLRGVEGFPAAEFDGEREIPTVAGSDYSDPQAGLEV